MLKILVLDHPACHWSALHGLGHLNHPLVRETVQSYLDSHRDELTAEDVRWLDGCRDGRTCNSLHVFRLRHRLRQEVHHLRLVAGHFVIRGA